MCSFILQKGSYILGLSESNGCQTQKPSAISFLGSLQCTIEHNYYQNLLNLARNPT